MTKPGYKTTEIGEIPILWQMNSLGKLTRISSGNTAPQDKKYFKNGKYPFIRVQHLKNLENGRYPKNFDLINQEAISELKLKKFKKDSIIFPKSGESIKLERRALLRNDSFVANHLAVIDTVGEKINSLFLFYYLSSIRTGDFLSETTMPSLNLSIIKQFRIPIPPLPEQQKIAEILSTADEAIQKVNEEITLTEKLKKGLLQTLLTKGIGHTKFKMTEIGEIPEEWKIDKVSNLKESMHYGITAKSTEQRSHLRFLRTTDISNFNFDPNDLHYCEITGTKPDLSKYYLKQGDIIVARAGTVGVSVLVKRDLPNTIFGSYLIKIAFNKDLIYANFVHYYFQSDIYWNKLRAAQGSTIKNISLPFLKALLLPVPPLQEQQKIAEILSTVDHKLELLRNKKTYLEKIKKGLMNDLLTGRVRGKIEAPKGEN